MLREEYKLLVDTSEFKKSRKGFYDYAVKVLPTIEKKLGKSVMTVLTNVTNDLGLFTTLKAIKGVTNAVRFNNLSYTRDSYKCDRCDKALFTDRNNKTIPYEQLRNFEKTT